MKKNKAFNLCMSDNDYEHLQILASNANMKPSEYIRTLIQIMYITNIYTKKRKLNIGGYGITLPFVHLNSFYNKLKNNFIKCDFDKLESKILITGQRNYVEK